MKHIKYLAAVALLLAGCTVSYYVGYHQNDTKNYMAASIMSDAIRLEYDNLEDSEKNSTYTAYSSLEEICCEYEIDTDSLLNEYVWCY